MVWSSVAEGAASGEGVFGLVEAIADEPFAGRLAASTSCWRVSATSGAWCGSEIARRMVSSTSARRRSSSRSGRNDVAP